MKLNESHIGKILRGTYNGKAREGVLVKLADKADGQLATIEFDRDDMTGEAQYRAMYVGKITNLTIG